MAYILPAFKAVSVTFACLAIATGLQGLLYPTAFATSFGIPIQRSPKIHEKAALSYASLMGVRQLATGITLLIFAQQGKWEEMATVLVILGFLVAGTDGLFLWNSGAGLKGPFHALPGVCIASLAGAVLYTAI
jgi:hypothetical protein